MVLNELMENRIFSKRRSGGERRYPVGKGIQIIMDFISIK